MHDVAVERHKWIDYKSFLSALNFCMLLPGPEAQQLATYIGWQTRGVRGGLVAGCLFVLPGAMVMLLLSFAYVALADFGSAVGFLIGIKAAVIAIILQALLRLARKVIGSKGKASLSFAAFLALTVFSVPFPLIILIAATLGALLFGSVTPEGHPSQAQAKPAWISVAICIGLWLALVTVVLLISGDGDAFGEIATFFSTMAIVTFGGAYAVLAYMTDQAVNVQNWLTSPEMIDALGLAETTPGPLILVSQFVGFLAAYRFPGALDPWVAGVLGAVLTSLVTFLPSFLWIFAGAPFLNRLTHMPRLQAALVGVTSAVVGVIAALALWFTGHVLFANQVEIEILGRLIELPELRSLQIGAVLLAGIAIGLLFGAKWSVPLVVGAMGLLGLGFSFLIA